MHHLFTKRHVIRYVVYAYRGIDVRAGEVKLEDCNFARESIIQADILLTENFKERTSPWRTALYSTTDEVLFEDTK